MTYTGRLFGRIIQIRIHGPINDKLLYQSYLGSELFTKV